MTIKPRITLSAGFTLLALLVIAPFILTFSLFFKNSSLSNLLTIPLSYGIKVLCGSGVFYGLLILISSGILKKVDLNPFASRPLREIVFTTLIYGILLGLGMLLLESFLSGYLGMPSPVFTEKLVTQLTSIKGPQVVTGLFVAFYKEVHYRLFLLPTILLILNSLSHLFHAQGRFTLLLSVMVTALISGIISVFFTYDIFGQLSMPMKTHLLLLATIPGIVFGWLFCTKGFCVASLAHFITFVIITSNFFNSTPPLLIAINHPLFGLKFS